VAILSRSRRTSESSLEVRCDLAAVKSPFSMKISCVRLPATTTPARYIPGRSFQAFPGLRWVCIRRFSDLNADASKKVEIGMISG
jgi:hypothetical protein